MNQKILFIFNNTNKLIPKSNPICAKDEHQNPCKSKIFYSIIPKHQMLITLIIKAKISKYIEIIFIEIKILTATTP